MKRTICCLALSLMIAGTGMAQDKEMKAAKSEITAKVDTKKMVKEALSAAIPSIADGAAVMDWENNVLREGSNGWTCLPSPPGATGVMPMCLDEQWVGWAQAWMNKTQPNITGVGFGYMLQGDAGGSNTDPYATEPTPDNDWIEKGGPHIMLLVPNASTLDNLPTAHDNGGPWVMWKGTPYVHVMIPTPGHHHQ